jgi:hypothetical protein
MNFKDPCAIILGFYAAYTEQDSLETV